MRILILCIAFLGFYTEGGYAQRIIPLYEGKAPGSENWDWEQKEGYIAQYNARFLYNVSNPALVAYLPNPAIAVGTAVVVVPGGGFSTIGIDHEAGNMAKWLNSKGIAAFVLRYRLRHIESDDPIAEGRALAANRKRLDSLNLPILNLAIDDGKKAIEYVRTHATEYNISPQRVGMVGFSAGATLTMGVVYRANAANCPDFAASIYANTNNLKNEIVPKDAPPLFICAATDDNLIPASHSSLLYNQWLDAKKQAELHIYQKGGHGFGVYETPLPVSAWKDRFADWLNQQGFDTKINQPIKSIPHLQKKDNATQLIVQDKPFLILGGELHNSSTSNADYMRPIWEQLKMKNLNTAVAPVYWELLEPTEGVFDFSG